MAPEHPQPTPFYRVRQQLGPAIDHLAHALGQREYIVRDKGYVGTVPETVPEFETTLRRLGFSWDPLSLYHHTSTGRTSDGSWTYRESILADQQLHAVMFDRGDDTLDLYAHVEPSWIRHPLGHALMDDIDRRRGVTRMRELLENAGIDHEKRSEPELALGRLVDVLRANLPSL